MDKLVKDMSSGIFAPDKDHVPRDQDPDRKAWKCPTCGEDRETWVITTPPLGYWARRDCLCWRNWHQSRDEQVDRVQAQHKAMRMKRDGFGGDKDVKRRLWDTTFERDDDAYSDASIASRHYAEHYLDHLKYGRGMLFCGEIGTGKTFYATCIANAVSDAGASFFFGTFGDIEQKLKMSYDPQSYLRYICKTDFLILDDFGRERQTSYGTEMLQSLIDIRYNTGKPIIVTTNFSYDYMESAVKDEIGDYDRQRMFDRILDMCDFVVEMKGDSKRRSKGQRR